MIQMKNLVSHYDPKSPEAELYKMIRTNIQFASVDKAVKVIVVTSAIKGEGKTTTAANIAVSFAQMGKKVLVLDCDLRNPKIHKAFGVNNMHGLTNILVSMWNNEQYILDTGINNLWILPSGPLPPNPSEMLASAAMSSYIKILREDYDYIFIDTPPINLVTDAVILSAIADGIIVVSRVGFVQRPQLKRARDILDKMNTGILGIVVNGIGKVENDYNYYYNDSYYYTDSGTRKKRRSGSRKAAINDRSAQSSASRDR